MRQYLDLVRRVLAKGTRKENRTGVDTLSTFGEYYEIDVREGFPLLTTKKMSFKNVLIELLWFLGGSDKSDFLERHGCGIWRPWYNTDGTVKNCYGPAWRQFPTHRNTVRRSGAPDAYEVAHPDHNDQIAWAIDELIRNPMSRRVVVNAWAPGVAQTAPLPPCHAMFVMNVQNTPLHTFTVYSYGLPTQALKEYQDTHESNVRARMVKDGISGTVMKGTQVVHEKAWYGDSGEQVTEIPQTRPMLCLHLTQRSMDCFLGAPYNIASYALLLSLFSRFTGIEAGIFAHSAIDAHVYTRKPDGSQAEYDHVPQLEEQLTREPRPLPRLVIDPSIKTLRDVERLMGPEVTTDEILAMFKLEGYDPWPALNGKVAV